MLQQPQSKLLAMIFDSLVRSIDPARLAQFLAVTPAILRPSDLSGQERIAEPLARPQIRHPDIVTVFRQTAPAPPRRQDPQPILLRFDSGVNGLRPKHQVSP
jgi:hypothetical protein